MAHAARAPKKRKALRMMHERLKSSSTPACPVLERGRQNADSHPKTVAMKKARFFHVLHSFIGACGRQDFTLTALIHGADHAGALHAFQQAGGAVVANLQVSLH